MCSNPFEMSNLFKCYYVNISRLKLKQKNYRDRREKSLVVWHMSPAYSSSKAIYPLAGFVGKWKLDKRVSNMALKFK